MIYGSNCVSGNGLSSSFLIPAHKCLVSDQFYSAILDNKRKVEVAFN